MAITNDHIAGILKEISEYLAMQNVPFKPRAYEKVAETIAELAEPIEDIYRRDGRKGIEAIPGVGVSIAEKIEEFIKTGKITYHEELKRAVPVDLSELTRVQGLGPKSIKLLYEKLGVKNLKDLGAAAEKGKIQKLEGFGKKKEENILKGLAYAESSANRFLLGHMMEMIQRICDRLMSVPGVTNVQLAGSARRRKETIGDIDILVIAKKPAEVTKFAAHMPEVVEVFGQGDTKTSVRLRAGINLDVRVVEASSYGAALNYFTGSKDHNVAIRQIAIKKGYKLNEYGLFKEEKQIAGKTEAEVYRALGLTYIEPELRENAGEIEAASKGKLPKLIGYDDLQGDLQVQTNWTDGAESIAAMAKAAQARGLSYIAITDHTKSLTVTNGLDEKRIMKQWAEIDRVNKSFGGKFTVLKGTECDILKDGRLDLPDSILSKLDVVGVSVHSYFKLSETDQTKRIIRAIENPNVDILFHPTGRLIGKREPYDVDMDAVMRVAKQLGVILEINAYPERSDLKDEYIRQCVDLGIPMSIDSDSHASKHFALLEHGIAQARRGWAEKKDVINAWSLDKMRGRLRK